jgi:hypothetical protein
MDRRRPLSVAAAQFLALIHGDNGLGMPR